MLVGQPALVANRMLLLRGMCAGKGVLRVSDLVERGGTRLLLNVLSVLEAGAAESVTSRKLPLVLDEFFLLFSSIVRYEAELEPLLARLAALILRLLHLGGSAAAYIQGHAALLRKLAAWYIHLPDLEAILEFLDPLPEASAPGSVSSMSAGSVSPGSVSFMKLDELASHVQQVAARLRMARHVPMACQADGGGASRRSLALGSAMEMDEDDVVDEGTTSNAASVSLLLSTLREAEV